MISGTFTLSTWYHSSKHNKLKLKNLQYLKVDTSFHILFNMSRYAKSRI